MRLTALPALGLALSFILGAASSEAAVVVFRQGLDGYMGTQDTELIINDAMNPRGGNPDMTIDQDAHAQGLLRFNDIFQADGGRIPTDSTLNSAELTIFPTNESNANAVIAFNRMLRDWDPATATWDSMFAPLMADDIDAVATPDDTVDAPNVVNVPKTMDVTASLQAWAGGASNFGWLLTNTTTNGFDFDTSENAVEVNRPTLTVDFTPPSMAPDFNGDGVVNNADFVILRGNMYKHLDGMTVVFEDGDVDFDLDVDLFDFRLFKSQFPGAVGAAAGVPEPSTLGLAVVALAGILLARRRRHTNAA